MTIFRKKYLIVVFALIATVSLLSAIGYSTEFAFAAETENLSSSADITNYADGTTYEHNGLGMGINTITASSINDFKTAYSILDASAIENISTSRLPLSNDTAVHFSASNAKELMLKYESQLSIGVDAEVMLADLSAQLTTGSSIELSAYSYKYYYVLNEWITRYNLYFNDRLDPSTYENAYSDSYLNALSQLKSGGLSYETFFHNYGTHLVGSAIYGGKLSVSYSLASNTVVFNSTLYDELEAKLDFPNFGVSVNANIKNTLGTKYNTTDLVSNFYISATGGKTFGTGNLSLYNQLYQDWIHSFDSDENCVVVDYTSDGLVPLWDILPTEYSSIASTMKSEYIKLCENHKSKFLEQFKTGNYTDFAGGTGSIDDPYVIATPKHLNNIDLVDMSACYILSNDIDLSSYSQWYPIGGYYKENPFTGVFDGKGYTIKNLKRTNDITEKNNGFYFGLFGYIGSGGIVRNLDFANVAIDMAGPAVNDSKANVFVGVVAGGIDGGEITNVTLKSGKCSNSVCTNGKSFVGGIVGLARNSIISNCTNNVPLTSGRYWSGVGGIAGYSYGSTFYNCNNKQTLTACTTAYFGYAYAGGIVGAIYKGNTGTTTIKYCSNSGSLKTKFYSGGGIGSKTGTGQEYGCTLDVNLK